MRTKPDETGSSRKTTAAELADALALLENLMEQNREDPEEWDVTLVAKLIVDKLREVELLSPPADMPDGYPVEATWRKRAQELSVAVFSRPVRDLLADVLRACDMENGRVSGLLARAQRAEQVENDRLYGDHRIADFQAHCCVFDPLPAFPGVFEPEGVATDVSAPGEVTENLLDALYSKLWHPNEVLQGRIKQGCAALDLGLFRSLITFARRLRANPGADNPDGHPLRPWIWRWIKIRPDLDQALGLTANHGTRTDEDYAEIVRTGQFETHLRGEATATGK